MSKWLRGLLLLAMLAMSGCSPGGGSKSGDDLASVLQPLLDEWRGVHGVPGVALVLSQGVDEPLVLASGVVSLESSKRLTGEEAFEIAGITKTFVAAAVLQLAEEGRLNLDDPISQYIGPFPNGDRITVRQVLSHRSGIYDYAADLETFRTWIADAGRRWTPAEMVALAAAHPPYFEPGTAYRYTEANYAVAAAIVEVVTGDDLAVVLRRRFFEPLGLQDTFVAGLETPGEPFLSGNLPCGDPRATEILALYPDQVFCRVGFVDLAQIPGYQQGTFNLGGWGIVSTARDLLTWGRALFQGQVLDPATQQEMLTFDLSLGSYGLGVMQLKSPEHDIMWGHVGGTLGLESLLLYLPDEDLLLVAFADGGNTNSLHHLVDSTLDRMAAKEPPAETADQTVTELSLALQDADPTVRRQAALALGNEGPAAQVAVEALVGLLQNDPEWRVREAAAQALGAIGPPSVVRGPLQTAALNDDEDAVRRAAQWALSTLQE